MTPSARIQAAIEILEGLGATALPADRFIRDWFRMRRYAGSKDRAGVAERVFTVLRHRASLAWRMQSDAPRALVIGSVLVEDGNIDALFDGVGYGPKPLSDDERASVLVPPQGEKPLSAQGEFPAFLEAELMRSLGDTLLGEMKAMQARAPVDLRVNTLKATRNEVLAILRGEGFEAEPAPYAPLGIRIPAREGLAPLRRHAAFENGSFEFQDEAAQIAVALCGAKPGSRILDLAAGAGGKALALAADMNNTGEILCCDIDAGRLLQIEARAARAGVSIIATQTIDGAPGEGEFDAVFVDAPCSGSGSWRRSPEQKWRLTPARLCELAGLQDKLLEQGAARVRPGGRLIYATCSLLACENEDHIARFLANHPGFAVQSAAATWREAANPPGMADFFRATPATTGTDGFFAAILACKDV
jgi:16S rRNA (cytosine967-C5)-methyltransferase